MDKKALCLSRKILENWKTRKMQKKTCGRSDFRNVKKGILDGTRLILASYRNGLITYIKGKYYINNLEQTLNGGEWVRTGNDDYDWGFRFILENYNVRRSNNCVNTKFGIFLLVEILNKCQSSEDVGRYIGFFKKIEDFLRDYMEKSGLKRFKPTVEDILGKNTDSLRREIAEYCLQDYFVRIEEGSTRSAYIDNTYSLMARLIGGKPERKNSDVVLVDILDDKTIQVICRARATEAPAPPPLLVVCRESSLATIPDGMSVFQVGHDSLVRHMGDISSYCHCPLSLYGYMGYGHVMSFRHIGGRLHICNPPIEDDALRHGSYERYSMLRGRCVSVTVPERELEDIRQLASLVRASRDTGIFFSEPLTLKLIYRFIGKYNIIYGNIVACATRAVLADYGIGAYAAEEYLGGSDFTPAGCPVREPPFRPFESYIQECMLCEEVIGTLSGM